MDTTTAGPATPAGVIDAAAVSLRPLADTLWAAKTPGEMLSAKQSLEVLRSQLAGLDASLCTEIEASGAAESREPASTADYLTGVTGGYHGAGRRWLRTAGDLTGERAATLHALSAGAIPTAQAEVICATIRRLPVKAEVRDTAEAQLLIEAKVLNASELKELGKQLLELLDPDGSEARDERALKREERSAHLGRFFKIIPDGLGGVKLKGRGTVEDAAWIRKAIAALAAPGAGEPADPGEPGEAVAGCSETGACDRSATGTQEQSVRDWDALVELCRRFCGSDACPTDHQQRPRIIITIALEDLTSGLGEAVLDTADRLSVAAVRKLVCDADLIPAVLGTDGEILDVGRTQRLVTAAIWTALVLRDGHCTFPGCSRLPHACDAHHIISWLDGGQTSLDNLTLLCRRHHTLLHHSDWEIRLNQVDHRPDYLPPAYLDRHRTPTRNRSLRC